MKYNILVLLLIFTFNSCSKNEEAPVVPKSTENTMISFQIEGIVTEIDGNTIKIYTPASLTNYNWIPTIAVSDKASVTPNYTSQGDFSNPIIFRVIAEDGTVNTYTTELILLEGLQEIVLKFRSEDGQQTALDSYNGEIDEHNNIIQIDYSGGSASFWIRSGLLPYLEIKTTGDVETIPSENDNFDLSNKNQTLSIPSFGKTYTLSIQNEDNFINSFDLPLIKHNIPIQGMGTAFPEYTIGLSEGDILFYTLKNQDLTNVIPSSLLYSDYATISPDPTIPQNFAADVTYTVTSETGVAKDHKVRVIEKSILLNNDNNGVYSLWTNTSFFTYYIATSNVTEVVLVNTENGETLDCEIMQNYESANGDFYLQLVVAQMPATRTSYTYRVTLEEGITIDTYAGIILEPN